jgi:hypothetical protein
MSESEKRPSGNGGTLGKPWAAGKIVQGHFFQLPSLLPLCRGGVFHRVPFSGSEAMRLRGLFG